MATVSIAGSCSPSGNPAQLTVALDNIYGVTTSTATSSNVRSALGKSASYPSSSAPSGRVNNAPVKKFAGTVAPFSNVSSKPVEVYAPSAVVAGDGGPLEIDIFLDSLHGASVSFSSVTFFRISAAKLVALVGLIVAKRGLFEIFPTKKFSSFSAPSGSLIANKIQTFTVTTSSSITASSSASFNIKELSIFEQFFLFFHRRHHRS